MYKLSAENDDVVRNSLQQQHNKTVLNFIWISACLQIIFYTKLEVHNFYTLLFPYECQIFGPQLRAIGPVCRKQVRLISNKFDQIVRCIP